MSVNPEVRLDFIADRQNIEAETRLEHIIKDALDNSTKIPVPPAGMENGLLVGSNVEGSGVAEWVEPMDVVVGRADNLISESKITEKVPYLYRPSGGNADIDWQAYDMPTGVTLNVNQLMQDRPESWGPSENSVSLSFDATTKEIIFDGTATGNCIFYMSSSNYPFTADANHIYLVLFTPNNPSQTGIKFKYNETGHTKEVFGKGIFKAFSTASTDGLLCITVANGTETTGFKAKLSITDLTNLATPSVANYIWTLESGTAGAGVSWALSHFPFLKNLAYTAPTLESVKTSAHKMVGFNHFNPTTGTAKLCGGYQWQITGAYTALSYSTGETLTPDAVGHFTPTDDGILTVTGGDDSTTCVHLVWDGSRDGEWEAYTEWNYPLDDDLTLRGYLKLDADNNLYSDGDTYASDGTVTRKRAKINLGDLQWTKGNTTSGHWRFSATPDPLPKINPDSSGTGIPSVICTKYNAITPNASWVGSATGITVNYANNKMFVCDESYSDADEFTTAMDGVYAEYEVDTPTTESATPYTNPQRVDNWGTEEYVDGRTIPIPVGHSTEYGVDDKAKLESAPNIPAQDGTYVVKVQSGVASYVALITPTELPPAPTTDGTYTLSVTVSSGTATYAWT